MVVLRLARPLAFALVAVLPALTCQAEPRAVIELFTSQGCSSCPSADKLLGELSQDPSLVAISLPITIWDYLGWKDTLARPVNTARQSAYAHTLNDGEVYTPEVVVNGLQHVIGSDRTAIERAIEQTHKLGHPPLSLPVALKLDGDKLRVDVPEGQTQTQAEVWMCPIHKTVTVAVARGENHGQTLTYHNVVRRWIKLGDWTGKAETWTVATADVAKSDMIDPSDSVAVLVQSGSPKAPGMILGAADTRLH